MKTRMVHELYRTIENYSCFYKKPAPPKKGAGMFFSEKRMLYVVQRVDPMGAHVLTDLRKLFEGVRIHLPLRNAAADND